MNGQRKEKKTPEVVTSNLLQYIYDIQDINIVHNAVQLHVCFNSWIYNVCECLVIFCLLGCDSLVQPYQY